MQQRMLALKGEASAWVPQWKDLQTYIRPTRGLFDGEKPNNPRRINYKKNLSAVAQLAVRTAAAGLHVGLTSPSRPWFRLVVADPEMSEYGSIRAWLDTVERRMLSVYSRTNIYQVFPTLYEELLTFGTSPAILDEDFDSVIWGNTLTCGEYVVDVDDKGMVNTLGREPWVTVGQMVSRFGLDNVHPDVRRAYNEGKVGQWRRICHLIQPNPNYKPGSMMSTQMEYISTYWDAQHKETVLESKGYNEKPMVCPRWYVANASQVYGDSPGTEALGIVKGYQSMKRDMLMGIKKEVDPPVTVDGSFNGRVNTLPGGITEGNPSNPGGAVVQEAYRVQLNIQNLSAAMQVDKDEINQVLYADLFRMMIDSDRRNITATEVAEVHEEKLMNLGPVLERTLHELHEPMNARLFNIMERGGLIPEPPVEVQGQPLRVQYISILAQAQQMVAVSAINQSIATIGSWAGLFPDVVDNIDIDDAAQEVMSSNGVPAKVIRSKEEVAATRKAKADAMAQAKQQQDMASLVQGAKTASEIDLSTNNAMTQLLGTTPPGANVL